MHLWKSKNLKSNDKLNEILTDKWIWILIYDNIIDKSTYIHTCKSKKKHRLWNRAIEILLCLYNKIVSSSKLSLFSYSFTV